MEDKKSCKFKQKVYEQYNKLLNEKVLLYQQLLQDLTESARNETKSSAGDKYETGRAMLQIEQDKVRKQLYDALEQKAVFERIDTRPGTLQIALGSLVKTNKAYFYLSLSLGKISVDGSTVIALSHQSPLGSKLFGLKIKEKLMINGIEYIIEYIE